MCRATPARVQRLDGDIAWLELDARLDAEDAASILEALAAMDALAEESRT